MAKTRVVVVEMPVCHVCGVGKIMYPPYGPMEQRARCTSCRRWFVWEGADADAKYPNGHYIERAGPSIYKDVS